jgi:hypothetical protein
MSQWSHTNDQAARGTIPYEEISANYHFDRDVSLPAARPARPRMKWYAILGKVFFWIGVIIGAIAGAKAGRGGMKIFGLVGGIIAGVIGLLLGLMVDAIVLAASSSQYED